MLTSKSCTAIRSIIEPAVKSTATVRCCRLERASQRRASSTFKSTTNQILLTSQATLNPTNQVRYINHEGGSNNQMAQAAVAGKERTPYKGPGRLMFQREMKRNDSQLYGTVHGGVTMQMLEEGGAIFSAQYCQAHQLDQSNNITTMTASLEKAQFKAPMFVGDIAEVYAELGYTSPHSMQVIVNVMAYNEEDDERRLVNSAKLWYVPRRRDQSKMTILLVPQMKYKSQEQEEKGRIAYEKLKAARKALLEDGTQRDHLPETLTHHPYEGTERYTVAQSRTQMIKPVRPSYCWPGEAYCRGGIPLKMIDDVGCISAVQYCKSFCVTISNDSTVFLKAMDLGSLLVANSKVVFTSSRSCEVKVDVDEVKIIPGEGLIRQRAVESILTCVTLDENLLPKAMPQLLIKSDEEQKLFDERKRLYDERKKEKAAAKAAESS